jgi:hypothetical protein
MRRTNAFSVPSRISRAQDQLHPSLVLGLSFEDLTSAVQSFNHIPSFEAALKLPVWMPFHATLC